MAKIKPHQIEPKQKYIAIDNLFEVISALKTKKEIVDFFLGLFSSSESLMLARRIQIAKLLLNGENYENIRKKLGVGNSTIQKTDLWLHGGDEKSTIWLSATIKRADKNVVTKSNNYNHESLLNKYPYHRFINKIFND
ncbi:MAG: Trp family transcriptional regulator [Candidatus Moranbacteria bacterium]|nr:Trp family transcriptional regulator [Candidatus Moranbacteria bacterium]